MKKVIILIFLTLASCNSTTMKITSPAFENSAPIPDKYSCKGENFNPELNFSDIPTDTKSLALIVDDPDAPVGDWVHWILWNIPVTSSIAENSYSGTQGVTSFGENKYGGPCPPSGTHRYYFKLFALDTELDLPTSSGKSELLETMRGHTLAQAELMGIFSK